MFIVDCNTWLSYVYVINQSENVLHSSQSEEAFYLVEDIRKHVLPPLIIFSFTVYYF